MPEYGGEKKKTPNKQKKNLHFFFFFEIPKFMQWRKKTFVMKSKE